MATHKELIDRAKFLVNNASWSPQGAVVEIGSQRHPNKGGSSYDLLQLANQLELPFYTVDFNPEITAFATQVVGDRAYCMDGVEFLKNFTQELSILYLDNFDVIYSENHRQDIKQRAGDFYANLGYDMSNQTTHNLESIHIHYLQIKAALPLLTPQAMVGLDDTRFIKKNKYWWGKGGLAVPFLFHAEFSVSCETNQGLVLTRGLLVS
jgi:hypothetical protein